MERRSGEAVSSTRSAWAAPALALLAPTLAAQVRLSAPLAPGGDVVEFAVAPDGRHVVYRADQTADGVFELFSVPIDGGAPVRLNAPLVAGGSVGAEHVHEFRISPDSRRVVYWADQDEDELFELFSVPIDGSLAPVQLNGVLVAGGDVLGTPAFLPREAFAPMTPDGSRVLFVADQEQDEVYELYCAPLDGSLPARKLSGALVAGGDVFLNQPPLGPNALWPQIDPDGTHTVYRADQVSDDVIELFSAPLDGSGPPVMLNAPLGPPGDVFSAILAPDGHQLLYVESAGGQGAIDLYRAPLAGTPPRARRTDAANRLNLPLGSGRAVSLVSISADSTRVAYQANPSGGASDELFVVPIEGGPSTPLSAPSDGQVFTHALSADGGHAVYLAGTYEAFDWKLISVRIDGSDRVRISSTSAPGYVQGFELVPDGSRAVYTLGDLSQSSSELHSTPVDGSTAPVRVNPPGTLSGPFRIAPEGREVVYLQRAGGGPQELHAAPIDASHAPRKLNGPLVPGGDVAQPSGRDGFAITSAGRVLYLADQDADDVVELYVTFLFPPVRRAR